MDRNVSTRRLFLATILMLFGGGFTLASIIVLSPLQTVDLWPIARLALSLAAVGLAFVLIWPGLSGQEFLVIGALAAAFAFAVLAIALRAPDLGLTQGFQWSCFLLGALCGLLSLAGLISLVRKLKVPGSPPDEISF